MGSHTHVPLTLIPMDRKSAWARGGKYLSQCAGSVNSLISSSLKPREAMICHWYFRPPVLASTLPFTSKQQFNQSSKSTQVFQALKLNNDSIFFMINSCINLATFRTMPPCNISPFNSQPKM